MQTVDKKQSTEKRMNGGGQTADEVIDKTYPVPHWRGWVAFLAREAQRFGLLADPQLLQQIDVLGGNLRPFPLRGSQIHGGLVKRRGGINNGAGMQFGEDELREFWSAGGFAEESRGAA